MDQKLVRLLNIPVVVFVKIASNFVPYIVSHLLFFYMCGIKNNYPEWIFASMEMSKPLT